MNQLTVREHLQLAAKQMAGLESGRLEAEILLAHCLEAPRSLLYASPEMVLSSQRSEQFRQLVKRRLRGEPIAYLTGFREFWSLPLRVTPDVLIPRPETERLVELALERIPRDARWRVADLGTGSGAIAIALASERVRCELHGTEINKAAISLARENAERLGIRNVQFHRGSWGQSLEGRFQLVASNPPYVAGDDPHLERGDCRFEPMSALTPGSDALSAIRSVISDSSGLLAPGGWLLLEHGPDQGEDTRKLLRAAGFVDVSTDLDLLGHERVSSGKRPE